MKEVRRLRGLLGDSKMAFAERIGISAEMVSKYETGRRYPDPRSLAQMMKAADKIGQYELAAFFWDTLYVALFKAPPAPL